MPYRNISILTNELVKIGIPVLELALEYYANNICNTIKKILVQNLHLEELEKNISQLTIKEYHKKVKQTKFLKSRVDTLCNCSNISTNFPESPTYYEVAEGYYTYGEVIKKIEKGNTPFCKTMKYIIQKIYEDDYQKIHIRNKRKKDKQKKPNKNNINKKIEEEYIVIQKDLFSNKNEYLEHLKNNKNQGLPTIEFHQNVNSLTRSSKNKVFPKFLDFFKFPYIPLLR